MRELLLLNLGGMNYGVWKDDVLSIRDVQTIHRLPLSPTCIAGMSILDGRTVTLADLAVCIGHAPLSRGKAGHILLMSEQEQVTGFVAGGDIGHVSVPGDAVYPMPDYLKTPVLDTCVVHASEPIPVINISLLYTRVQTADREPPVAEFLISTARPLEASSVKSIRVFESGGEPFAASAAGIEEESVKPGRVSPLVLIPPYVRGLAFHRGKVLPVIHLSKTMKLPEQGAAALMAAAEIGGASFGFLIDADEGTLFSRDFSLKSLPPLALSRWMRIAALRQGQILPLIDLAALLSARFGEKEDKPLPERYSPDSPFLSLFGREDVEVVEFSLLGARHALPRLEVEDTLDFRPYRRVPNVQPIMAGVTEYEGELLPVLDLAMVFGRRSLVTPEWRMLLIKNGDFRAFVMTEAVYGARRVSLDMQRGVPIVLPHHVVYGCYPEAGSVRLILNVEALAVHFDRALVKGFLSALSKEMEEAPSEIVPSLIEAEAALEMAEGEGQRLAVLSQETVVAPASLVSLDRLSAGEEKKPGEIMEPLGSVESPEEPVAVVSESGVPVSSGLQPGPVQIDEEQEEPVSEIAPQPEVPESEETVSMVSEVHEPAMREEPTLVESHEGVEPVKTEGPAELVESFELQKQAEGLRTEDVQGASEETEISTPGEPGIAQEEEREKPEPMVQPQEPEYAAPVFEKTADETEQPAPQGAYGAGQTPPEKTEEPYEQPALQQEGREYVPQPVQPWQAYPESSLEKDDRNWLKYAGIVAVVLVVLYLSSLFIPSGRKDTGKSKTLETVVAEKKPVAEPKASKQKPAPAAPPEPLTLTIPPEMPLETDLYIVKKGDTLWAISKRFTGNPFNYPRVARDNKIANADLIFPGQKIFLKK